MHMDKDNTQKQQLIKLAREKKILSTQDVLQAGIHHQILRRLCDQGVLEKTGRGLYKLSSAEISVFYNMALVAKKAPRSVICLISALAFHELTTQIPRATWIAIEEKARQPQFASMKLRVVRFSRQAFREGVEEYKIEGVPVKITNPARTVADCFKYRNKIGLDIALEALKEGLRDQRFTRDELWQYAKLDWVTNVIRPYLESMT